MLRSTVGRHFTAFTSIFKRGPTYTSSPPQSHSRMSTVNCLPWRPVTVTGNSRILQRYWWGAQREEKSLVSDDPGQVQPRIDLGFNNCDINAIHQQIFCTPAGAFYLPIVMLKNAKKTVMPCFESTRRLIDDQCFD